ncbi:hypothetical protein [Maricaulis virginensis]|uniref:Uncharacterized protein n=1 Tax=Maricaulis virginensis TaxID=144022 RepID=A0A9W6IR63_9PROT|nr:hypothetical protein [Maricaulis virginensis]GLK53840.1 hypothetical protein GCM10017621_33480 [Maricaulis virginensis]
MLGTKVIEIEGRLVAIGPSVTSNAKTIYEYLDFETANGRFKTGKSAVSHNNDKHITVGAEGVFVLTRYLGRAVAMTIKDGDVEVNPIFRGLNWMHFLFPLVFFLVGLFFAPLWIITIPIWFLAGYFLILPSIVTGRLKTIARKHGVSWKTARKGVDF